ncbi:MAG: SWIM zinc finger family protein [Chitinophagaceae bacterium]
MPETEISGSTPFSASLLKAAKACTVRECDETKKRSFVAYVDEGEGTFDVTLQLDAEGNIVNSSCDCELPNTCKHIVALFIFLSENQKVAVSVVPKKKATKVKNVLPHEALFEEADAEKLKDWLRGILATNKELALTFTHQFRNTDRILSPEEAITITNDAVKSVMGRAHNPDPNQVKRILGLWKTLHKPIVDGYKKGLADENGFKALQAMLDVVYSFYRQHHFANNAYHYIAHILEELAPQIATLAQLEAFEKATGFFIDNLQGKFDTRPNYLIFLQKVMSISSSARKVNLAHRLATNYSEYLSKYGEPKNYYFSETMLIMIIDAGLFTTYADAFKPIPCANAFNGKLLSALINAGMYQKAEQIAWAQISASTDIEYNNRYLLLLRELYQRTNNLAGQAKVAVELLPQTFDFDDYLLAISVMEDPSMRVTLRRKLFKRARHMAMHNKAARDFSIRILVFEEKWDNLINYVDDYGTRLTNEQILENFEQMYSYNSQLLLYKLLSRRYDTEWATGFEIDKPETQTLANKIFERCDSEKLRHDLTLKLPSKIHDFEKKSIIRKLKILLDIK